MRFYELTGERMLAFDPNALRESCLDQVPLLGLDVPESQIEKAIKSNPSIISPDRDLLLIRAQRKGQNGRLDLLCLDQEGRRVVIELKRGKDWGIVEQALGYQTDIVALTLEDLALEYAKSRGVSSESALAEVRSFVQHGGQCDSAPLVEIILVAEYFPRRQLEDVIVRNASDHQRIRCIRLAPHRLDGDRIVVGIEELDLTSEAQIGDCEPGHDLKKFRNVTVAGKAAPSSLTGKEAMHFVVCRCLEEGVEPAELMRIIPGRQTPRSLNSPLLVSFLGRFNAAQFRATLAASDYPDHIRRADHWFCKKDEDLYFRPADGHTYAVKNRWDKGPVKWLGKLREQLPDLHISFIAPVPY